MACVEEFIADHRGRRGIQANTAECYRRALRAVGQSADVDELTPERFHTVADERGWSVGTRASYWTAVAAYSAYRVRRGLAPVDPFDGVRSPRSPDPNPKPVTAGQLALLQRLAHARAHSGRANAVPIDEWVTLAAYAGLRCCEIVRVRGEHLRHTPNGWELDVPHGKGGSSASIPAHPDVVKLLSRKERGLLYPGVKAVNVHAAGQRLFSEAGIGGALHRLRHTFATSIYQATKDPFKAQRLCRHKSLSSTLSYAKVPDRELHDAIGGLYR